jgi:hypothetical protein
MIKHRHRAPGHPERSRGIPRKLPLRIRNGIPRPSRTGVSARDDGVMSAGRPNLIRPAPYYYQSVLTILRLDDYFGTASNAFLKGRWIIMPTYLL